jgi:hypothetical protein
MPHIHSPHPATIALAITNYADAKLDDTSIQLKHINLIKFIWTDRSTTPNICEPSSQYKLWFPPSPQVILLKLLIRPVQEQQYSPPASDDGAQIIL